MPDPIVQIEGVGNVQFPASMSEVDIAEAAHRLYTDAGARQIAANPPGVPGPGAPQMQMSNLGIAASPTQSVAGPGEASYVAEADPESQARMLGAAAIGAGGASGVIPAAARKLAPIAIPAAGGYAIQEAKKLPVVGPIISKIPAVEYLPFLLPLTKGRAGKAPAAGAGTAAAEAEAAEAAAAGPFTPQQEQVRRWWQLRGGAIAPEPIDRAAISRNKTLLRSAAEESQAVAAGQGVSQTSMRQVEQQSSFPPPAPVYRKAPLVDSTNRAADIQETRGIQEMMRDNLQRTGAAAETEFLKEQAVRNIVSNPKGVRIEDFRKMLGQATIPSKPVKLTRTPGVKAKPVASSMNDLTELLRQSVIQANAKKAKR